MVAENLADDGDGHGQKRVEEEEEEFFYYFAYGSNLLTERIHVKVKGAEFVSVGLLANFQLCFYDHSTRWQGAIASIERGGEANSSLILVYGCVWRVPARVSAELDAQETGYHRMEVDIVLRPVDDILHSPSPTLMLRCRTYQYSNPNRRQNPPSPHYKQVIVAGAVEHSLPQEYIELLHKVPTNGYQGSVDLHLKAIEALNSGGGIKCEEKRKIAEEPQQNGNCGEGA